MYTQSPQLFETSGVRLSRNGMPKVKRMIEHGKRREEETILLRACETHPDCTEIQAPCNPKAETATSSNAEKKHIVVSEISSQNPDSDLRCRAGADNRSHPGASSMMEAEPILTISRESSNSLLSS